MKHFGDNSQLRNGDKPADGRVFEYLTNLDNIKESWPCDIVKESWPCDIVKESENVSCQKSVEGSAEMKVAGEYMGNKDEMLLEVVEKGQDGGLATKQTEGPFQKWGSIPGFQSNGGKSTRVTRAVNYELPCTGKIANFLSESQAEGKIRQGIRQSALTAEQIYSQANNLIFN